MMNWAKQQMANVVGTQEPIYGPSAVQSVAEQAKTTPYTELTKDDVKWTAMDSTSVETQIFYLLADSGHIAFVQVIYSSVAGIRTTCQWNTKVFYPKSEKKPNLWSSDQLSGLDISEDKLNFYADNCAIELSEDGTTYSVKSLTNEKSIVNVTIKRVAPGFQVGKDGTTNFGTDPAAPWGTMRHVFWPRNTAEGTIVTEDGPIDFKGKAVFIHCLQGMKPHHLAARWNFANFQGPDYSAIMMEFTTPPSYGSTVINVGAIVKGDEIVYAGSTNKATHIKFKEDPENSWPEPEEARYEWKGKTKDGKDVEAVLEGPLDTRLDRIDIMAEVPFFVKKIIANAAGTKPYIYQYSPTEKTPTLKLKVGDEATSEEGVQFCEATFISE